LEALRLKPFAKPVVGLAAFLFFSTILVVSQAQTIPDGTQGEIFDNDSISKQPGKRKWNLFKGEFSSFKLGGGFLYEYAGFSQDQASRQQLDSIGTPLEAKFKVRDFRLVMSGELKRTRRSITWRAGFMYDAASDSWLMRETGVMIGVPELSGYLFLGRTKEGFSMNKVMNGYAGWGLERQMAIDVIPILADGIKWLGYFPKPRLFFNVGAFVDWFSEGQSFSTYNWQTVIRAGWLPVYQPDSKRVFHVGTSWRYGDLVNGSIRVRSRPEANPAPYFIDTGNFLADRSFHLGIEAYYSSGPWMVGTEYYGHSFHSSSAGNPFFQGGEVMASYMITGESRAYRASSAIYAFVPVPHPVLKGGWGSWEVVLRATNLHLDDGPIRGGKLWRITPMVNWYLNDNLRLEFAYGYGVMERFGLSGTTQFYQTRLQFIVL